MNINLKERLSSEGRMAHAPLHDGLYALQPTMHRTIKTRHPWTDGQVERMNRTIEEVFVKRFSCESHGRLRQHLADLVAAYNFARRLKTPKGRAPHKFVCRAWTAGFEPNPLHQMPG